MLKNSVVQFKPSSYQIVVKGRLSSAWKDWFNNLAVTYSTDVSGGTITTLTGLFPHQGALYGIVNCLRDLGLTLLEIHGED